MTDAQTRAKRLLVVHAHPDDEVISTGVTLAKYASEGVGVTLVTCTSGEEGEVLIEGLSHLTADRNDTLGEHRREELATALKELGVKDHRYLGGPGRFRDSGMIGTPANLRDDAFARADLLEVAKEFVSIIREVCPQVVITYDDFGGYGHPDHLQAHRGVHYAIDLAAIPSFAPDLGTAWQVQKLYWTSVPRSLIQKGIDSMINAGDNAFFGVTNADELPFVVDDELITTQVVAPEFVGQKMAALRAHATQIEQAGPFFALAEQLGPEVWGSEFYRLVGGGVFQNLMAKSLNTSPTAASERAREEDLFFGVA